MTEPQVITRPYGNGRTVYYDQQRGSWYDLDDRPAMQEFNERQAQADPHSNGGFCDAGYCEACAARSRGESV